MANVKPCSISLCWRGCKTISKHSAYSESSYPLMEYSLRSLFLYILATSVAIKSLSKCGLIVSDGQASPSAHHVVHLVFLLQTSEQLNRHESRTRMILNRLRRRAQSCQEIRTPRCLLNGLRIIIAKRN